MAEGLLEGRQALVTGGAQGLGAGMAQALAAAGATVMIGDVQDDLAAETAQRASAARSTHLDVTDEASWEAAVAATIEQLGGLDILVNNAGIEISGLIVDAQAADLKQMLEVNVLGTALGIKHGLRAMRPDGAAGNGGAIVNISSVAATIAFPGIAGYSATKSAVDRLTRVAAFEAGKLGFGVRVNCVYPGLVPTEMGQKLAVDMATSACSRARRRRSARWSSRRRSAASARSPTWPTRSSSSRPTRRASSRASACPSTAGWACSATDVDRSSTTWTRARRSAATRRASSKATRR